MKKLTVAFILMIALSSAFAAPNHHGVNTSDNCQCIGIGIQQQFATEAQYQPQKYPQIKAKAYPTSPRVLKTMGFVLFMEMEIRWLLMGGV